MQQPHFDRNYYTGLSLVAKDTGMPTTVVQEVQERHRDFTQIPNILLDSYADLPETALVGFFRLLRHCGHRGCKFVGSIRKLSNLIQMAKSTVARIVPLWVKAGFVKYATQPKEDENREEMVITLCLKDVWEQNAEYYSHPENCPKLGQSVPERDTDSAENASTVPNWDNTVPERDAGVPPVSTKVGSNTITNTDTNTNISSTSVDDALPPYEGGLKPRSSPLSEWLADITLMDEAFLAEMEKLLDREQPAKLSTPVIHSVDTESHIVTMPTRKEEDGRNSDRHNLHSGGLLRNDRGVPLPDTQPADRHLGRITQDERLQINEAAPPEEQPPHAVQEPFTEAGNKGSATRSPTRETRKSRGSKKVVEEPPAGPPQMPPEDAPWNTTTCLHLFNAWRGVPLVELSQIKYANGCAKRLTEVYSREQIQHVYQAMNEQPYWKERGGADICDVARHMQKELNKLAHPPQAVYMASRKQYKPAPGEELVEWQGRLMTEAEADTLGFNGGFGAYK